MYSVPSKDNSEWGCHLYRLQTRRELHSNKAGCKSKYSQFSSFFQNFCKGWNQFQWSPGNWGRNYFTNCKTSSTISDDYFRWSTSTSQLAGLWSPSRISMRDWWEKENLGKLVKYLLFLLMTVQVRTFMLQIAVLQNHQQGRDTHLRQVRSNPANSMKSKVNFTKWKFCVWIGYIRWRCTVLWRTVWSRPQSWATTPRSASSSSRASGVHYDVRMNCPVHSKCAWFENDSRT